MISNRWGECSSPCEENSPCENKGTCNFDWVDQKEPNCTCPTGYSGEYCERKETVKGTSPMSNILLVQANLQNFLPTVAPVLYAVGL